MPTPRAVTRARNEAERALTAARLSSTAREVRKTHLTYLSVPKMRNLERCAGEVERRGVPGAYVEAGVALGGSAILLASLMGQGRRFHGYDVFEQIPPPSERDGADAHERYRVIEEGKSKGIGGDAYYGYLDDLYGRVVRSSPIGAWSSTARPSRSQGYFEDTRDLDEPVALAHIDCDWHDPVAFCLERIGA